MRGGEGEDEIPSLTKFGVDIEEDLSTVHSLFLFFFTLFYAVPLSAAERKDGTLETFSRSNSVRDRMRRFTDAAQSPSSIGAMRSTPLRHGTSSKVAAGLFTSKVPSSSQTGQWQSSGGVTTTATLDESRALVAAHSEKDEAQGREVARQEAQQEGDGAAELDMKTFLTIEIKDGRSSATTSNNMVASSSTRGNIVPITTLTPRFNANSLGQRTGRSQSVTRGR